MPGFSTDLKKYDVIVGYGIGKNYAERGQFVKKRLTLDYLADKRWEDSPPESYDGIPVICFEQLKQLKRSLIVLFPRGEEVRNEIREELRDIKADICYVHDLVPIGHCVSGEDLRALLPKTEYEDEFHNRVWFDHTVPTNIRIHFFGGGSLVCLGANLFVNRLELHCGNCGSCVIQDGTSIQDAIFHIAYAAIKIGKDCMLSEKIMIRTHDFHHIFDRTTQKRINVSQNVIVGNKVWVGYGAVLLPGAQIGAGSIVGENAVTSSCFGENKILAGCPARVIREDICWSSDNTAFLNHMEFGECMDQTACRKTIP